MKHSKLLDLISVLQADEIKDFNNYISNMYLGKSSLPFQLWQILHGLYPNLDDRKIEKEKVYKKIFGKEVYIENRIAKIMTELFKILEDFIFVQQIEAEVLYKKLKLMEFYQKRQLNRLFQTTQKEAGKLWEQEKECGKKYYLKYEMEVQKLLLTQTLENRQLDFQNAYDAVVNFSEGELLRLENLEETGRTKHIRRNSPNNLFYNIHKKLERLKTNSTDQVIQDTYIYIKDYIPFFAKEESREILNIFLNHAIRWVNQGKVTHEFLLDVYQIFIDKGVLLQENKTLFIATYKNYITCALRIGRTEQASIFLETYKPFLPEGLREEAYLFNKANILFEEGRYKEILQILSTIKSDDIFYNIHQRRLYIKTLFELFHIDDKYYDLYLSYCGSFKKFIYTDEKIPEYLQEANKSFLKILQKIESLEEQKDTSKKNKILKEIHEVVSLAERDWLMKQLALLG